MALGRVLGDKFTSKFSFGLVFIGDSKNTSAHSECIPQTPQTSLMTQGTICKTTAFHSIYIEYTFIFVPVWFISKLI